MKETKHIKKRDGCRLIGVIPEGWSYKLTADGCLMCHPDHPPRLMRVDGTVEELKPGGGATQ